MIVVNQSRTVRATVFAGSFLALACGAAVAETPSPHRADLGDDLLAPAVEITDPPAAPAATGFSPPGGVWSVEVPNISYSHDGAPTPVPLPAALPAFLLALLALAWRARRWIVA